MQVYSETYRMARDGYNNDWSLVKFYDSNAKYSEFNVKEIFKNRFIRKKSYFSDCGNQWRFYLVYRHGLYKDPNNPVNTRYVQYFCRRLCQVFNLEVQVHGTIPREPALWVSNHISWLDIAVLGSGARVFFLAKAEIEKWPILGNLAKGGGTLFIKRGSGDSIKIREQITEFLKQNIPVLFFLKRLLQMAILLSGFMVVYSELLSKLSVRYRYV